MVQVVLVEWLPKHTQLAGAPAGVSRLGEAGSHASAAPSGRPSQDPSRARREGERSALTHYSRSEPKASSGTSYLSKIKLNLC